MNYHQYYPVDVVNGPGTRCTLFVAGCVHECVGCYNKSTWRLNSGQPFTQEQENRIIANLQDTVIPRQGISLSGGDPLHPQNVPDILRLVERIRAECPGKDIWVWTGYVLTELTPAQQRVVESHQRLSRWKICARSERSALIWRGSSNQVCPPPAVIESGY
nr:anaerobic ribonucleoside-triphosphate reductase-activating protein [Pectobacterium colocasium]